MSEHFKHCYIHEGHLCSCGAASRESRSEPLGDDGWDNLPPHLRTALTEALEGLSEAYLDVTHPLSPQLQAVWDVTDQIEAWLLAQERTSGDRE